MNPKLGGLERWRGKTALITGASAGIGWATAHALAGIGMRVAITARRADKLEQLKNELRSSGTDVLTLPADLSQPEEIAGLFQSLRSEWGGADVLINNAGLGRRESLQTVDPSHLQSMLDINLRAATLCMREALHDMKSREDAAIVNISSLAGHRVPPGSLTSTFYSATKHALRALTEGLRMELAAEKSTVKLGTISPGLVETEFHDVAEPAGFHSGFDFIPLHAEDVAAAILYLLSTPRYVQISDIMMRPIAQQT